MRITESQLRRIVSRLISEAAGPQDVAADKEERINFYKSHPRGKQLWAESARNDYYGMASVHTTPSSISLRNQYYKWWRPQDFMDVIRAVDGKLNTSLSM